MNRREEFEDVIERAYWIFDARVKGYGEWRGRPQSERDAFKDTLRSISTFLPVFLSEEPKT